MRGRERVHAADRARMQDAWADFCRQPRPIRFDSYRTQADDGSVRHFSEQVVAADGTGGWVGTITDVTDLVTARDHLRKAETMFRNTFDQAPVGIVHADRRGRSAALQSVVLDDAGLRSGRPRG